MSFIIIRVTDDLGCLRLRTRHCLNKEESSKWIARLVCHLNRWHSGIKWDRSSEDISYNPVCIWHCTITRKWIDKNQENYKLGVAVCNQQHLVLEREVGQDLIPCRNRSLIQFLRRWERQSIDAEGKSKHIQYPRRGKDRKRRPARNYIVFRAH
jgi:hypothetical protein